MIVIANKQPNFSGFQSLNNAGAATHPDWYILPESYEDAARYAAIWLGDTASFQRSTAQHQAGAYSLAFLAIAANKKFYAPAIVVAKPASFSVYVMSQKEGYSTFDIAFAVNATMSTYYSIRFKYADTTINIVKSGVGKKSHDQTTMPDTTWRELGISWAADGTITWTFAGETDNWLDGTPLTASGIGVQCASAALADIYVDNWHY